MRKTIERPAELEYRTRLWLGPSFSPPYDISLRLEDSLLPLH